LAVLTPVFWVIGIAHFGVIIGRDPTRALMLDYVLWTSVVGIPVFGFLLFTMVRRGSARLLGLHRACAVAAVALAPVQAATYWVTLYQRGNDELVVLAAFAVALLLLVLLTNLLVERRAGAKPLSFSSPQGR
jgi:hypothetical protein